MADDAVRRDGDGMNPEEDEDSSVLKAPRIRWQWRANGKDAPQEMVGVADKLGGWCDRARQHRGRVHMSILNEANRVTPLQRGVRVVRNGRHSTDRRTSRLRHEGLAAR